MLVGDLSKLIVRAHIFKHFTDSSIIRVKIDDCYLWFLAIQYRLYNPSNHIHYNELTKCKDITDLINSSEEYDADKFMTKLDNKSQLSFSFNNSFDWFLI